MRPDGVGRASVSAIEATPPPEEGPARVPTRSRVPDAEIAELRDVQFSTALRGYDRDEVDRFVARVNQVLAVRATESGTSGLPLRSRTWN